MSIERNMKSQTRFITYFTLWDVTTVDREIFAGINFRLFNVRLV